MREPCTFAAADIEHALNRMTQEVLGRRDRDRNLSPYFTFVMNAMSAAAIPLVEVLSIVLLHKKGRPEGRPHATASVEI